MTTVIIDESFDNRNNIAMRLEKTVTTPEAI